MRRIIIYFFVIVISFSCDDYKLEINTNKPEGADFGEIELSVKSLDITIESTSTKASATKNDLLAIRILEYQDEDRTVEGDYACILMKTDPNVEIPKISINRNKYYRIECMYLKDGYNRLYNDNGFSEPFTIDNTKKVAVAEQWTYSSDIPMLFCEKMRTSGNELRSFVTMEKHMGFLDNVGINDGPYDLNLEARYSKLKFVVNYFSPGDTVFCHCSTATAVSDTIILDKNNMVYNSSLRKYESKEFPVAFPGNAQTTSPYSKSTTIEYRKGGMINTNKVQTLEFSNKKTETIDIDLKGAIIGAEVAGGKIFYINRENSIDNFGLLPGDGLVMMTSNLSEYVIWGTKTLTGANSYFNGIYNTAKIISTLGTSGDMYAARLCAECREGGYDDWYLPSFYELVEINKNLEVLGSFTPSLYWSSMEQNENWAHIHKLVTGSSGTKDKTQGTTVRCIRRILLNEASELSSLGYTLSQARLAGYAAADMKAIGHSINELKDAGYTLWELKTCYSISELKSAGFTTEEFKTCFTIGELKSYFTIGELKSVGFTIDDFKTVFTKTELFDSGEFTLADIDPRVGDALGGGIVFYVNNTLTTDRLGLRPGHGLIAMTSDLSDGIIWGADILTEIKSLSNGKENTEKIISILGTSGDMYAARLCAECREGGYDDWYLPSYREIKEISDKASFLGVFKDSYYWCSLENSETGAVGTKIITNNSLLINKNEVLPVRCIRRF